MSVSGGSHLHKLCTVIELTDSTNHVRLSSESVCVPSQKFLSARWASVVASMTRHDWASQARLAIARAHIAVAGGTLVVSLKSRSGTGSKGPFRDIGES